MDDVIRIEKLENGFEVECLDPAVAEANSKPKSMWKDPYKGYAFSTAEEVIAFIGKKLGAMKSKSKTSEYDSAFKEAATKGD